MKQPPDQSHGTVLTARLDAEAASLADGLAATGRIHAWVGQVQFLIEDLRAPGWAERAEKRAAAGNRRMVRRRDRGCHGRPSARKLAPRPLERLHRTRCG